MVVFSARPAAQADPNAYPGRDPARGGADDPRIAGMKACFVALMTDRPLNLPWVLHQHCCKAYARVLFTELMDEAERVVAAAKETFANPPAIKKPWEVD